MKEYDYYNICYGLQEGNPIIEGCQRRRNYRRQRQEGLQVRSVMDRKPHNISVIQELGLVCITYTKQNYKVYSDFYAQYLDYKDRGWMHLNVDYYIPAGTLIDCDGINPDGTYINGIPADHPLWCISFPERRKHCRS